MTLGNFFLQEILLLTLISDLHTCSQMPFHPDTILANYGNFERVECFDMGERWKVLLAYSTCFTNIMKLIRNSDPVSWLNGGCMLVLVDPQF